MPHLQLKWEIPKYSSIRISGGANMSQKTTKIAALLLRLIALVMAVLAIVLSSLHAATAEVDEVLLGIGLLALVLASFLGQKE